MVLGQRSDPGDAFNQFWDIMQGMLDNLSQPVAFATAPLGQDETPYSRDLHRDGSLSSDTDIEEGIATRLSRKIGLTKRTSDNSFMTTREDSFANKTQSNLRQEFDEVLADEDDELAESFCLIPSGDEPATLSKENASMKTELTSLRERLASVEAALKARQEQDLVLRGNILSARKEAQRVMTASAMGQPRPVPDFGSLNLTVTPAPPPPSRDREAQLTRKVRELEEDMKVLRAENESQKQIIIRFRERWNGLKESAKRKKEAKAVATAAAQPVREKILEEPEPDVDEVNK